MRGFHRRCVGILRPAVGLRGRGAAGGEHEAGSEYGPALFAACGGHCVDIPAFEGRPVVTLTADGDPEIEMIAMARKYMRLADEARQKLGLNDSD